MTPTANLANLFIKHTRTRAGGCIFFAKRLAGWRGWRAAMVNLRIYQKEGDGRVGSNKMIFREKALGLD